MKIAIWGALNPCYATMHPLHWIPRRTARFYGAIITGLGNGELFEVRRPDGEIALTLSAAGEQRLENLLKESA